MTTSLVAMQFSNVCFIVLSLTRRAGEKISVAGFTPNTLKKLSLEELDELNIALTKFAKKMKVLNKKVKESPVDL